MPAFPSVRRAVHALALVIALCATLPAAAQASHEQGGFITAKITSGGQLQGTLSYLTKGSCTVGTTTGAYPVTVKSPLGTTAVVNTGTAKYTRCVGGSTGQEATFDINLATAFNGVVPDGAYTVTFSTCCRVGGIKNVVSTATSFTASARKWPEGGSSSPVFASNVSTGIAKGYDYLQFMNASDPDGGGLSYASRAGQADGPSSDVITLTQDGVVSIPALTTAGYSNGWTYVYKVRVIDDQGDFAERDVLLTVTANNKPPTIDLGTTGPVTVTVGTTRVLTVTASDPNSAAPKIDTVKLSAAGLPAWATLATTPGNPATGTLTLAPPANLAPQALGINFEAVDSDSIAALSDSDNLQVEVVAAPVEPPPPAPRIDSAPSASASSSTFAFSGDGATGYECRVDGDAFVACSSPFQPAGLADGSHTFEVRSVGPGGHSGATAHTWSLDTAAPLAPAILAAPAPFEFAGEPGGSFECRLDAGAWEPCSSPKLYPTPAAGPHGFGVRQTDAAGNVGAVGTYTWEIAEPPVVDPPTADPPTADPPRELSAVLPPRATATVKGDTAVVGCRVDDSTLESCGVRAYGFDGRRWVYIGRGRQVAGAASDRLAVDIELNARGRRLMARTVGGLRVRLRLNARTTAGATLSTRRSGRFVPERQLVVPATGTFRSGSAVLTRRGRAFIKGIARGLRRAHSIKCTGHTDAIGPRTYNRRLGARRAGAACRYLRHLGVHGRLSSRSYGEARPRATNATIRGRALNRRIELRVRYR
jgi:outer membrane protein OmpA-like peptidoglycan-associated protein